jgi:hypothetical protein
MLSRGACAKVVGCLTIDLAEDRALSAASDDPGDLVLWKDDEGDTVIEDSFWNRDRRYTKAE